MIAGHGGPDVTQWHARYQQPDVKEKTKEITKDKKRTGEKRKKEKKKPPKPGRCWRWIPSGSPPSGFPYRRLDSRRHPAETASRRSRTLSQAWSQEKYNTLIQVNSTGFRIGHDTQFTDSVLFRIGLHARCYMFSFWAVFMLHYGRLGFLEINSGVEEALATPNWEWGGREWHHQSCHNLELALTLIDPRKKYTMGKGKITVAI